MYLLVYPPKLWHVLVYHTELTYSKKIVQSLEQDTIILLCVLRSANISDMLDVNTTEGLFSITSKLQMYILTPTTRGFVAHRTTRKLLSRTDVSRAVDHKVQAAIDTH